MGSHKHLTHLLHLLPRKKDAPREHRACDTREVINTCPSSDHATPTKPRAILPKQPRLYPISHPNRLALWVRHRRVAWRVALAREEKDLPLTRPCDTNNLPARAQITFQILITCTPRSAAGAVSRGAWRSCRLPLSPLV